MQFNVFLLWMLSSVYFAVVLYTSMQILKKKTALVYCFYFELNSGASDWVLWFRWKHVLNRRYFVVLQSLCCPFISIPDVGLDMDTRSFTNLKFTEKSIINQLLFFCQDNKSIIYISVKKYAFVFQSRNWGFTFDSLSVADLVVSRTKRWSVLSI